MSNCTSALTAICSGAPKPPGSGGVAASAARAGAARVPAQVSSKTTSESRLMCPLIGSTRPAHEPMLDWRAVLEPLLLLAAATAAPVPADPAAEVQTFREDRERRLRAPDGWLSLVGLVWLHPGANRFGSAPDDEVRMPASTPAHAGTLVVDGSSVRATIAPGVAATLN